ncbi:LCP family protein [Actinoplanes sp. NPDC049681]|uniref:LCP family protein n=1 Tax=Actinoplanes sp. NPDC049681 TaxID=3363905 RepID=UPI0037B8E123
MSPIEPSPIEEELRAAFARHEADIPAAGPVRAKIDIARVRAKRRRRVRRSTGAAAALLIAIAPVPVLVDHWRHTPAAVGNLYGTASRSPEAVGPLDVLLLGSDNRAADDDPANRRADMVMMVHLPADRSRVYLVSLPRDGAVQLPGGAAKLTATMFTGGPQLTQRVVSDLTGVDFDATVTVDFRALRSITEAVGGVELCLPARLSTGSKGKSYEAGCRRVGPEDVTPILRGRYGLKNGAYDRDRNAQRFLRSLATKLTLDGTTTDPGRLHSLIEAGRDGITVDGDMDALLGAAGSMGSAEVIGVSAPSFHTLADGREQIYPGVGPALYAAIRADRLGGWADAHPDYVLR